MQKWENIIAGPLSAEDAAEEVKRHGLQGFELVSVTVNGGWFYIALKRPLTDSEVVVDEPKASRRRRVTE